MMSNGPCSARRSVQQRLRARAVAASIVLERAQHVHVAEALRARARAASGAGCGALAAHDVRAEVRGPGARALRSWQTASGRSSTIATGEHVRARARARPAACAPRAARWSRRPRSAGRPPGACAAMKCRTVERVLRSPPGRSRRRPRGRGRSRDESTSVGLKCARGERRLAGAGGADQHDQRQLGNRELESLIAVEHRHLRRRADLAGRRCRPAGSARDSRAARRRRSPTSSNSARVHSKRWSRWRNSPAGSLSKLHVVLGVRRRQDDGAAGARDANTIALEGRPGAAGRGAR